MNYNLMCLWVCFYAAPVEDDSNLGGLNLGGYEKHQQKLRQERKEEYRKYLAEVLYLDYGQVERSHNPYVFVQFIRTNCFFFSKSNRMRLE